MKTDPVRPADLSASVIAVPPLALNDDLVPDTEQNRRIIEHLHAGGVTSYLYGGNANFFSLPVSTYASVLEMLVQVTPDDGWTIPSFGPDFGKALDQARILRDQPFPTAMLLPLQAPVTPDGVATAFRRLSDAAGKPLVAYVKYDNYLDADLTRALLEDGVLCSVKYAIERENPLDDPFLENLVRCIGTERLVSGIGERPVRAHLGHFGLTGFTSGSVCIAPRLSMAFLDAVRANDQERAQALWDQFEPLEDLRDRYSPIRVLHEAVRLAGIAETGPMAPLLSGIADESILASIQEAARALFQANR